MNKTLFLFLLISILFCNASPIKGGSCPNGMVLVPAGEFTRIIVTPKGNKIRKFYLDSYCVDKFEVSEKDYFNCVSQGICDNRPLLKDYLVNKESAFKNTNQNIILLKYFFCDNQKFNIYCSSLNRINETIIKNISLNIAKTSNKPVSYVSSFNQAQRYCSFVGKRLLTEAEWEKAARGDKDSRIYPWGNEKPKDCKYANISGLFLGKGKGCPNELIDANDTRYPPSPYGVYNLVGNTGEYVIDVYHPDCWKTLPDKNPICLDKNLEKLKKAFSKELANGWQKTLKGTSYYKKKFNVSYVDKYFPIQTPAEISNSDVNYSYSDGKDLGFRCASSPLNE